LDKGTRKEQNKDEMTDEAWIYPKNIRISLDPKRTKEIRELTAKIDSIYEKRLAEIDKAMKSIFANKGDLELIRWLTIEEGTRLKSDIGILYGISLINERLATIETELQKVGKKVKVEMPNLKEKVDKITQTPAVQLLSKILQEDLEKIEKINKRREKLIRDSVV
jgi:hypothetical protein